MSLSPKHPRARNLHPLLAGALLLTAVAAPAGAAPLILKTNEPDKHGVQLYTVKCEGGGGTLVQCLRNEQRCGYNNDEPLNAVADKACARIASSRTAPAEGDAAPTEAPAQ